MKNQFEGFVPVERFSEDEAHDEANMMKAELKEAIGHEPTAQDYQDAYHVVENMKDAAANETNIDKILLKIKELESAPGQLIGDMFVRLVTSGKFKLTPPNFDSAEEQLRQLQSKAEELERA